MQDQPYLVNIEKLQRHWLLSILLQQPLPLASRPLLVPVSYPIKQLSLNAVNNYRQSLCQAGI